MPAAKRVRTAPTEDWEVLQLRLHWPEQQEYELIRPVVVFGLTPAERAEQTGAATRTIACRADVFNHAGFAGLLGTEAPSQRVPEGIRDAILLLKGEYPAFNPHELASIAAVRFGRRLSHHTVARVLAEAPLPAPATRGFAPYHQLPSASERRMAIIRLRIEGWSVQSTAGYLQTSRPTLYSALKRRAAEDFAGLPDKPRIRKRRSLKVDLRTLETARQRQENPELGAFRLHSRLKEEFGIDLSVSTCGRILRHNRARYGLPRQPKTPKAMPFAARYPHQYWTVNLRYIDVHRIDGGPVYCIFIMDSYSHAILASALSRRQDLSAYLVVLYAALREYGCPEKLVSDNGSIFKAEQAEATYAALGIERKRIEHHQPWQSYIETTFNVQRRMADWDFAKATSWVGLQKVHDRWVEHYNTQEHGAHRTRRPERRTPASVLPWVICRPREPAELALLFAPVRYERRLDRAGYVQLRRWRVHGNRAVARQGALVWLSEEILTVRHGEEPLAYYTVKVNRRGELTTVMEPRVLPTRHHTEQTSLWTWTPESDEWRYALPVPPRRRRWRRRPVPAGGVHGCFSEQVAVV